MTDKDAADAAAEVDLAHSRRAVVVGAVRHIVERFFNLVHSRTSLMRVRDICTQCDADGDGRVTREEFGRALTRLRVFLTAEELEAFGLDRLKEELMKNGLKCGGTLAERAQRLFLLRDKTIDEIDAKYKPPVRKEKRR